MSRYASTSTLLCAASLLAGAFVPVGGAHAATRLVTNCSDSGAGSLRNAVASALSGDTIDLRSLSCTRIVLTSGEIAIPQNNLTLLGRSRDALAIDGRQTFRVFGHTGTGTLRIRHLTVAWGYRHATIDFDRGGCIKSNGNVELHRSRVHHCQMLADGWLDSPPTAGGGISALGNVVLSYSAVFDNTATTDAVGGGIQADGQVTLHYSQVFNNRAFWGGGVRAGLGANVTYSTIRDNIAGASGGGLYLEQGDLLVNKSTISNNRLFQESRSVWPAGGGIFAWGAGQRAIIDSTFSGNHAARGTAAYIQGDVQIYNSTIAFNVAIWDDEPLTPPCEQRGALRANVLTLESTIVANNECINGVSYDVGADTSAIIGSDNLIFRSNIPVPTDTIWANPRLASLAANGGPTRTHMLFSDSPAINHGGNVLNRAYDQRGPGFPRVKGAFPDIGAIER
jgi:hypothetical protein